MNAQTRTPPVLTALSPTSGPAGQAYPIEIVAKGQGFARTDNVVRFGPATIAGLASPDGTELRFQAPKTLNLPGAGQTMVLHEGDYEVTVSNAGGTSNALKFRFNRNP